MAVLDWIIVIAYMLGMIGMSVYLGRGQSSIDDYYVGGRQMPWWAVGISTMATQSSAISFISKPAFVALKPGGGLTWLQFELAVPLAMIVLMAVLVPFFRRLELVSVYEYLELRFDPAIRYLVSGVFLVSRGLAAAVVIYATAIVLSVCMELDLWMTILMIGVVTVIYDTIGGMTAVIYSDVIQLVLLLGGVLLCIGYAVGEVGSVAAIVEALPADRWTAIDPATGFEGESAAPFWGILIGGFFLYISYYGTDQSQVQRELSAESDAGTKKSLLINGLARFPLTVLYIALGVAMYAVYAQSPELQAAVPADNPDHLVPEYILHNLPVGIRALLIAAILAAAMSSIDSTLNSLSAATMRDFIGPIRRNEGHSLILSKLVTVGWGAFITGFAFFVGAIDGTVVEAVNKIGSAFYGPIAAAFLTGVLSHRANTLGIFAGIVAGVGLNLVLWVFFPEIYWMWWNVIGCVVAVVVTLSVSPLGPRPGGVTLRDYTLDHGRIWAEERSWLPVYALLAGYFVMMLALLWLVPGWFAG